MKYCRFDLSYALAMKIASTRDIWLALNYFTDMGLFVMTRYEGTQTISIYFNSEQELLMFRLKYSEYL